jgi:hypothetical protein
LGEIVHSQLQVPQWALYFSTTFGGKQKMFFTESKKTNIEYKLDMILNFELCVWGQNHRMCRPLANAIHLVDKADRSLVIVNTDGVTPSLLRRQQNLLLQNAQCPAAIGTPLA